RGRQDGGHGAGKAIDHERIEGLPATLNGDRGTARRRRKTGGQRKALRLYQGGWTEAGPDGYKDGSLSYVVVPHAIRGCGAIRWRFDVTSRVYDASDGRLGPGDCSGQGGKYA